jgi:hypothetical protein
MSDINRILIFCILVGLLYALYKYQDVILEQIDLLQPNKVPLINDVVQPNQNTNKALTYDTKKITVDNISQISLLSFKDKGMSDSMSNSDNDLSILLDDNSCESKMTRNTYGSLFDD